MADMHRCKACKWFKPLEPHWFEKSPAGWGECLLAAMNSSTETWNGATHPESLAVAQDREGYMADLKVNENFGCVQWEQEQDG